MQNICLLCRSTNNNEACTYREPFIIVSGVSHIIINSRVMMTGVMFFGKLLFSLFALLIWVSLNGEKYL